jgi:hypothetical protein
MAQLTDTGYRSRLRAYPLLPHQFILEDTVNNKLSIAVYNAVDKAILYNRKDSIMIDSRVIANDLTRKVLAQDWQLFNAIRIRYFDRYDMQAGYEWSYNLAYPRIIGYELYNIKKMMGEN